jgi:hypothetical protein
MQIQWWEGAAWSCAEAVREGGTPDRSRPAAGCCEKGWRRAWLKKLEQEIHSAARQRGTERVETREEFELDKSRFMPQPRPPVENAAGFQQR